MDKMRILLTDDCGFLSRAQTRDQIEQWVAHYGGQGFDAVAWDLLGGDMGYYRSDVVEMNPDYICCTRLIEQGVDPPGVISEACHRHGLGYWPAVRLNAQRGETQFKRDNPDALLTATTFPRPGMLDYESPKVQRLMLDAMRELVERWDADGLLLDFVRYWFMFHEDRLIENASLLTHFMGDIRAMMDEVGEKKGKYIPLVAQVLPRVSLCLRYSMDVKAWAKQGHVQYLLPSRPNNTDFNLPVEQFMAAVEGTECRVFPVLHPATNHAFGVVENKMTAAMFRAGAHAYYQAGAHGLATMNLAHFPKNLIHELRDVQRVAQGPHHYRYSNHPYDFGEGPLRFLVETPLPLDGDRQMLAARKVLPFRLATDPKARFGGVLQLRIENLHPGDELHIELNGELILRSSVIGNQGQFAGPHDQCRCPYDQPRLDELCHFIYEFDLSDIPVIQGENELSFQILRGQLPRHHAIVSQVDVIFP